jgi:hypothetical protein
LAAAGTLEGASARRWLQVQGAGVKCLFPYFTIDDIDAERLPILLAGLPAVRSISRLHVRAIPRYNMTPRTAAAIQAMLAGVARAVAGCSCLQHLYLYVELVPELADQLPETFWRLLAGARALEELRLSIQNVSDEWHYAPSTGSVTHLVTGLAGLSRLRALSLYSESVRMEATLPACMSCLAQLTSLSLSGLRGLRGAPGWARLPSLAALSFRQCRFAGAGEAALPGMGALVSLTGLDIEECPSLRELPTALSRLTQLRCISFIDERWTVASRLRRTEPPVAGVPAVSFESLVSLSLVCRNLRVFPVGILAATGLTQLSLSSCRFGQLPQDVGLLSALKSLQLGRDPAAYREIGGEFNVQALGSLAAFPDLRYLSFADCRVLFCTSMPNAAGHPCLETLLLDTSYPAAGASCQTFLGLLTALLQQGRSKVIALSNCAVQGEGQEDSQKFFAALASKAAQYRAIVKLHVDSGLMHALPAGQ